MAETEKHDKTEEATPQRIRKAREDGNLLRARELVATGSIGMAVGLMVLGSPLLFMTLREMMSRVFLGVSTSTLTVTSVPEIVTGAVYDVMMVITPFFILLAGTGVGLTIMQSGWNITAKPLVPKGNRISPLQGFKRIFSKKSLFELLKSILKIGTVGPIAYLLIRGRIDQIVMLPTLPVEKIISTASGWIILLFAQMLACLAVLSGIDFLFEQWRYKNELKMSRRDVKDEMREQEGSPELRSRRRQLARENALRPRLDHAVLNSDVVVTNPTHYAIALRYDAAEGSAPRVLVKGIRKRALRIKALASDAPAWPAGRRDRRTALRGRRRHSRRSLQKERPDSRIVNRICVDSPRTSNSYSEGIELL